MKTIVCSVLLLTAAAVAAAEVPAYDTVQLQLRTNNSGAYNIPDGADLGGETAQVNGKHQVAIGPVSLDGGSSSAIWFGAHGAGAVVYTCPAGAELHGSAVNDSGRIVFELSRHTVDGVYAYDTVGGSSTLITSEPAGATGWEQPQINSSGEVAYRATVSGYWEWVSYSGASAAVHAAEVGVDGGSPYSLLYLPSFNDSRQMAGKVRLGALGEVGEQQPDQIRIFSSDGSSILIAEDQDSFASSPYVAFDDHVALTDNGMVAFVAERADGSREVVLSDGISDTLIATDALVEITAIESFAVAANNNGLVAFRGIDGSGLAAVAVGDGTALVPVATEHDTVTTDLGAARIDQADSSPVFSGAVSINHSGDVAFAAALTAEDDDQVEWGVGLFVVREGYVFADGFESGNTSAWTAAVP